MGKTSEHERERTEAPPAIPDHAAAAPGVAAPLPAAEPQDEPLKVHGDKLEGLLPDDRGT